LGSNGDYRLELVSTRLIKRMPGLNLCASQKGVAKVRDLSRKRGYYKPVILSDSQGCMTLIAGAATFEACLEDKARNVPALIVRTEGEADNLIFSLQSTELDDSLSAIATSAAITRLIDTYSIPRKQIAEVLGKSPAWINKMENLSRRLNGTVQEMVARGQVAPRSAQEIARLPDEVQTPFAVSAVNEFLSKENVIYLVNRYLNQDIGHEERDRIINTPKLALPNELRHRGRMGRDNSESARLSRAIARCLDDVSYLSGLLTRIDIGEAAIRISDVEVLTNSLATLHQQLQVIFLPG